MTSHIISWIGISLVVLIPVVGVIANWFRVKGKKVRRNKLVADSNTADIRMLKKALIIALKKIDKQTEKAHGEDPEIACLVKDLLSDEIDGKSGI